MVNLELLEQRSAPPSSIYSCLSGATGKLSCTHNETEHLLSEHLWAGHHLPSHTSHANSCYSVRGVHRKLLRASLGPN
jgi:hypothetical protein